MQALAHACRNGKIRATVNVVISDRADAGGIDVARELGVETAVVPWSSFADRAAFEHELAQVLEAHRVDVIVLAGFMRVLSPEFAARYAGQLINIHPALLPKYRGLHTHRRVLEAKDAQHGASVHFATAELDGGPVVLQSRINVRPADTEQNLALRVLRTEHVILPKVIGWLADGRLTWQEGRGYLDGKPLDSPVVEDFEPAETH